MKLNHPIIPLTDSTFVCDHSGIMDVRTVAKAGDTERDIGEALNAGCGQVIGVLSGADGSDALENAGAQMIVDKITDVYAHD